MFSGTEVAKASAKIWLLDDKFASVVTAVVWGRQILDNIRKFVQFQLTVNVCALLLTVISAISGFDVPLTAVQLLWVNLIMDTLAALALGTEVPTPEDRIELLSRRPEKLSDPIITARMWKNILLGALVQLIALLVLLYASVIFTNNSDISNWDRTSHYTVIFNSFVWLQLWNQFNARKINGEMNIFKNLFSNHMFMTIWFITIFVQVIVVEFAGSFADTTGLNYREWLISIAIGFLAFPTGFIVRLLPSPNIQAAIISILMILLPQSCWAWAGVIDEDEEEEEEGKKLKDEKSPDSTVELGNL